MEAGVLGEVSSCLPSVGYLLLFSGALRVDLRLGEGSRQERGRVEGAFGQAEHFCENSDVFAWKKSVL